MGCIRDYFDTEGIERCAEHRKGRRGKDIVQGVCFAKR